VGEKRRTSHRSPAPPLALLLLLLLLLLELLEEGAGRMLHSSVTGRPACCAASLTSME
jgi:hypothetical protein